MKFATFQVKQKPQFNPVQFLLNPVQPDEKKVSGKRETLKLELLVSFLNLLFVPRKSCKKKEKKFSRHSRGKLGGKNVLMQQENRENFRLRCSMLVSAAFVMK